MNGAEFKQYQALKKSNFGLNRIDSNTYPRKSGVVEKTKVNNFQLDQNPKDNDIEINHILESMVDNQNNLILEEN